MGDINKIILNGVDYPLNAGLDVEAQDLLIEILTSALYKTDQSANILALESNLSGGLTKYTITYNLVNTDSSNTKKRILEQSEYTTTLTAQGGFSLLSATVIMDGIDITSTVYSNGVVNIPSVTGNISISAASEAQMELLESITLANGAYIDTEYVPASLNDQIIMGVMLAENPGQYKPFAGVTRLPSSATATELYTEYIWTTGQSTPRIRAGVGAYKNPSIVYVELRTVNGNYLPHDVITSKPFYFSIKNGEQKLRANMELTESLVTNSFNIVNASTAFTSAAQLPIDSIYLGAVHDAGSRTTENQYTDGVTFFGFRVFDANGNMIIDMKPAINGSYVGMYDLVRGELYEATNGTVGTDITYTEVSAE